MTQHSSKAFEPINNSEPKVKELVLSILKLEKDMLYEDRHNEIRDEIIRLIKEKSK